MITARLTICICLLGAAMAAVFAAIAGMEDAARATPLYVGLFLAAFALYIAAARVGSGRGDRAALIVILGFAVLFRLILLPVRPTISSDIYRYVWDGRVAASGTNPYLYPPASPKLAHLRDADWRHINYKGTATPYPPMSQIVFLATGLLFGGGLYSLKAVFVLFDICAILLILATLSALRLPRAAVIYYAWSPLVVTEFAGSGHQDAVGVMLLLAALYAALRLGSSRSGALLAASILVKPCPLPSLPAFVRANGIRTLLWAVAAGAVLYAPFAAAGPGLFAGALSYAREWQRNDSVFALLDAALAGVTLDHERAARMLAAAIVVASSICLALGRDKDPIRLLRRVFISLAVLIAVSPTVYPWYLTWTVPFLCFVPSPGWLLFTGTVGLSYLLRAQGEPAWIRPVEYLPVYALLLASTLRAMLRSWGRERRQTDPPSPR